LDGQFLKAETRAEFFDLVNASDAVAR